ncbi:hypothetical protein HKD37_07G019563 [Glycine soja]
MGSEIYPEVHENPRAFFSSSSPILLEPFAHGSSDWSLPREDCIRLYVLLVEYPGSADSIRRSDSRV